MNKKIISICGTRPEIIRVIRDLPNHFIIDTGQHYDYEMDEAFWEERGFKPDLHLHARSMGEIYDKALALLKKEKPSLVLIYGDTRSSFSGAFAAKDAGFRVMHLEAGVRGGDLNVPEERHRIAIDSISDFLMAVNAKCAKNLYMEGTKGQVFVVGDLQLDRFLEKRIHKGYIFMTIHRQENQNAEILKKLFNEYKDKEIFFPIHPVMKPFFKRKFFRQKGLNLFKPMNHQWTLDKIKDAELIVTDSGGLMREAFFAGVPVRVILKKNPWETELNSFGDGNAEAKIKKIILDIVNGKIK